MVLRDQQSKHQQPCRIQFYLLLVYTQMPSTSLTHAGCGWQWDLLKVGSAHTEKRHWSLKSLYPNIDKQKREKETAVVPMYLYLWCSLSVVNKQLVLQHQCRICSDVSYTAGKLSVCSSITWLPFPSCSTIACSLPLIFGDFMWNHFQKYLRTVLYRAIVPIFSKDYELGLSKTKCLAWKHAQALWYIRKAHGRFLEFQSEL